MPSAERARPAGGRESARRTARIERLWYGRDPLAVLLAPLGWAFCAGARLRRWHYTRGLGRPVRLPVAVVVVGNLTAGGTGKTPLVVWIARFLGAQGWRPAVIARGYGGRSREWPQRVHPSSDPAEVGDEPVVLARRCGCPVVAGPDRAAAARLAIAGRGCDVVVSDDGLQALRLARDVEIAVVDGDRRFGNGRCLPAGPLREAPARLASVDLVVARGPALAGEVAMQYRPGPPRAVADEGVETTLASLATRPVHAVAGIGNPGAFFRRLRELGLRVIEEPFPDHHRFSAADLEFGDGLPVLMTEKDAVKCRAFARRETWYLPIEAELDPAFGPRLLALLSRGAAGARP
jgi:tetraacyldisaccharide 4'-kinase